MLRIFERLINHLAGRMFLFSLLWSIGFFTTCFTIMDGRVGADYFFVLGLMELPILLVAYPFYEYALRRLSMKTDIKALVLYLLISVMLFHPLFYFTAYLVRLLYT